MDISKVSAKKLQEMHNELICKYENLERTVIGRKSSEFKMVKKQLTEIGQEQGIREQRKKILSEVKKQKWYTTGHKKESHLLTLIYRLRKLGVSEKVIQPYGEEYWNLKIARFNRAKVNKIVAGKKVSQGHFNKGKIRITGNIQSIAKNSELGKKFTVRKEVKDETSK